MAYGTYLSDSNTCDVTQVYGSGHLGSDIQFIPIKWSYLYFPKDGIVTTAAYGSDGLDWSYGWHYEVTCLDGTRYRMAHLDSLGVGIGVEIVAGQYAGVQGSTGNTTGETGIHLHLEYFVNGARTSPEPLMGFPDAIGSYDIEFLGGGTPHPPPLQITKKYKPWEYRRKDRR